VIVLALVLSLVRSVHAQRPVEVGIGAGFASSFGRAGSGYPSNAGAIGRHAHAWLAIEPKHRLSARFDALYHVFTQTGVGRSEDRIPGVTASLVYALAPAKAPLRPYVLGGVGKYRRPQDFRAAPWHVGASGGVGVRFTVFGVGAFAEARVHHVDDQSVPWIAPLTAGVRF
jgi:hypothetical protein